MGLVRSLRSSLPLDNVTINAVAPATTVTPLIPTQFIEPILQAGLPTSSAEFVARALVYSAVAMESRQVELYGKEYNLGGQGRARWNGRVILTLGDKYTELEEQLADLRTAWFGEENMKLTRLQQAVTDRRDI